VRWYGGLYLIFPNSSTDSSRFLSKAHGHENESLTIEELKEEILRFISELNSDMYIRKWAIL